MFPAILPVDLLLFLEVHEQKRVFNALNNVMKLTPKTKLRYVINIWSRDSLEKREVRTNNWTDGLSTIPKMINS